MAFAFGDSYLKLPPITKESAVESDAENSKSSSCGLVRDNHGLVRLPPIVRLDSLRSTPSSAQSFSVRNEVTDGNECEMTPRLESSVKIAHKMDVFAQGSSKKVHKYVGKREDETKLINESAAKETSKAERHFFNSEHRSTEEESTGLFRSKEKSRGFPADEETTLLYRDRTGRAKFKNSQKLSSSRRLAKSSPELCHRKINSMKQTAGVMNARENRDISLTSPELYPESCSLASKAPRLSVHDIDGSVLFHLQDMVKNEGKTKREKRGRSQKGGAIRQPLSTPNSPVCSESANHTEHKQKGRKSLNDITETVKQFIDRRKPSISAPKKQNLIDDASGLKIEGKSCPQGEKEGLRTSNDVSHAAGSLLPPQKDEKRHSLYDLEQFLNLLQREVPSGKASPPGSSNVPLTGSDSDKSSNASVYDLREFLVLAATAEASSGRQLKKTPANKLRAVNETQGGSSPKLLSPNQERERVHDGARKGSVYDLMEFLSLGNTSHPSSASTSENSSRSASPRILISPRGVGTSEWLSVSENSAHETRRSSTYDLMEFLSLPRSGGNSRPESGQSNASSQGDNPANSANQRNAESESGKNSTESRSLSVYDLAEFLSMTTDVPPLVRVNASSQDDNGASNSSLGNEHSETERNSRDSRSLSVYDLAEFLSMTSGVPPLVRVTTSDEEQTTNRETDSKPREMERRDIYKKDSLSDLGEIPNVMEQEHSVNTLDAKKSPPSPPKTASSGYASDSTLSTTDPNNLQGNDNTNTRQMSVYDLREFLSLYASQQSTPSQQISTWFTRKFSSASQSGISIHVTDANNRSLDLETDEVFLPVPGGETTSSEPRKRSSVYDLREFLNILNADDSPLRRRLSSVSSSSSKSSESESDFNPSSPKSDTNSAGSGFGASNGATVQSRPQLSPRQDSGGNVSLYDLGEFLSLLNTDDSPLRRRLSSAGDIGTPKNDAENLKSPLYSLEEILTVLNEFEQKKVNENTDGDSKAGNGDEISIPVPSLPPRNERSNAQPFAPRKRLSTEKSLNTVPETSDVKARLSL